MDKYKIIMSKNKFFKKILIYKKRWKFYPKV